MLKEKVTGMATGYTVNAPQWVNTSTQAPEFKSFYKTVSGNEGNKCNYPTRLDLYGCGCFHDCSYCYAKSLLNFRGLWHPDNPSVFPDGQSGEEDLQIRAGNSCAFGWND